MTSLLLILGLILVGSRASAVLAGKVGMPGVFGELMLGIALGPLLARWDGAPSIEMLAQLGVLMLMLVVGLETDPAALRNVGRVSALVATAGALLPFGAGAAVAWWLGQPTESALFVGVALSATSVSITAATLRELGRLQSHAGTTIMMAAVIDDVLGLMLLSFVTGGEAGGSPLQSLARLSLFLGLAVVGGRRLLMPALRLAERHVEELLALAVGVGLLFAWASERIGGLAPITGAYLGGLLISYALPGQHLNEGVGALASGFFSSIFFVSIGMSVQLAGIDPLMVLLLLALAIATKMAGCGIGARVGGLSRHDAVIVGIGMVPRGEVALIVASLGLKSGILSTPMFSALVIVAIATTVVAPVLLRIAYRRHETPAAAPVEAAAAPGATSQL